MKDLSFKAINLPLSRPICRAAVAFAVRKSQPNWVTIRLTKSVVAKLGWQRGSMLAPFADEKNRALLLLSDQRPTPESARRAYGKNGSLEISFPRVGIFAQWFSACSSTTEMPLVEATHGRLVVLVPTPKSTD